MQGFISRFFDSAFKTIKLSPKVALPGALLFLGGAALLVVGLANNDHTLRDYGIAGITASGVVHGVGYVAPPGTIIPKDVTDLGLAESGDGEGEAVLSESGGEVAPVPDMSQPDAPEAPPPQEPPATPPPAAPAQ